MFHIWLVYRFVTSGRRLLNLPAMLSLIGMALGVASLVAAMGVVSGFENTLKTAIIDVFGDTQILRRVEKNPSIDSLQSRVKELVPDVQTITPFVNLEGLIAREGRIAGVLIQGMDPSTVEKVLKIRPRVVRGEFVLEPKDGVPSALVGKTLAKRFKLEVGDEFKIVLPTPSRTDSTEFTPKLMAFRVRGILDLGKAEYDERYVVTDLRTAQKFGEIGDNISGVRLKLKDSDDARRATSQLAELGPIYFTMDWTDVNRNLFEAVKIERIVIFLVIMVMVIAASFNISSNLFVSVLQKYGDLSILRAMGFSQRDVIKVYVVQGLFFGLLGTLVGIVLGLLLCVAFVVAQKYVILLPVETYRVDHVGVEIRVLDLLTIVGASALICLLSTLAPALRASKLNPVEGLRYE